MHIPDMTEFGHSRQASPFPFPPPIKKGDIWGSGQLPAKHRLIAVGWLGQEVPSKGETPGKFIRRLFQAHRRKEWIVDGTAGWHDCELCSGNEQWYPGGQVGPIVRWGLIQRRVRGYGHFLVQMDETVFMAPVLVLHYIIDHGYRPPDAFLLAVEKGKFLSPQDLDWIPPDLA